MKRSELTVGAELFYAEPSAWKDNQVPAGDGGYRLGKAKVLAIEPYAYNAWRPRGQEIEPASKGSGVLVEIAGHRRVVQLGHLRGPWEATLAEVKERHARDLERMARHQDEREQRAIQINAVVQRLADAGATSAHRTGYDSGSITVRAEELTALLDRLDALEHMHAKAREIITARPFGLDG